MAEKDKGVRLRITTDGSGVQGGQEGTQGYPSSSEIAGIFFPLNGKDFKSALFKNLVALGAGPAFVGFLGYLTGLEVSNEVLIYSAALGPACIALARGLDLWLKYNTPEAIAVRMKTRELREVQKAGKDDEKLDSISGVILGQSADKMIEQALKIFLGFNLTRELFGKVPGEKLEEMWEKAHLKALSLPDNQLKNLIKGLNKQPNLLIQMIAASFLIDVVEERGLASVNINDKLLTQDLIRFYKKVYLPARKTTRNRGQFIRLIIENQKTFPSLEKYEFSQLEKILESVGEYVKEKSKKGGEYLDSLQLLITTLISCPYQKDDLMIKAIARLYSPDGKLDEGAEDFRNFLLLLMITDGIMGGLEVLRVIHSQTWSNKGGDDWINQLSKEKTRPKLTEIINSLFPPEKPVTKIILNVLEKISNLSAERDLSPLFYDLQLRNNFELILWQIRQMMLSKEDSSFYILGALTAAQQLFNNLKVSQPEKFFDTLSPAFLRNFLAYLSLGIARYSGLSHPSTSTDAMRKLALAQQNVEVLAEGGDILSVIMAIAKVTFNNLENHFFQRPWLLKVLFDEAEKLDGFLNKLKKMPSDKFWENDEISHFLGSLLEILSKTYEKFDEKSNDEHRKNIIILQAKITEIIINHIPYLVVAETDKTGEVIFPIGDRLIQANLATILKAFANSPAGGRKISFLLNLGPQTTIQYNGLKKDSNKISKLINRAFNFFNNIASPDEKLINQEEIIFATMFYIFSTLSAQITNIQARIGHLGISVDRLEKSSSILKDSKQISSKLPSTEAIDRQADRAKEDLSTLRAEQETINSLIVNTLFPYFKGLLAGTNVQLYKVMINPQNELILQMSILL